MRIRSTSLPELRLRLPRGWYEIPTHMPWAEVRELANLLAHGLPDVEHVLEFDWPTLKVIAAQVASKRAIVAVHVPKGVTAEVVEPVLALLEGVTVGLVQYDEPNDWPDVAWQERYVKVPLLSLLKRDLQSTEHPLAKLGVAGLAIDELAKLTPEPIELWTMIEGAIDHRLEHVELGAEPDDWARSVRAVVAKRLAARLAQVPKQRRDRVLDVLLDLVDGSLSAIEHREASEALTHAGLAWREGDDVLVSPLARLLGDADILGRVVGKLPNDWPWSGAVLGAVCEAMPKFLLPALRTTLVVPEPPYARWPAVDPSQVLERVRSELLAAVDREAARSLLTYGLELIKQLAEERRPNPQLSRFERRRATVTARTATERTWFELLDACVAALNELGERHHDHRFERLDVAATSTKTGRALAGFVRWAGIQRHLDSASSLPTLMSLANEVQRGLDLVTGEVELTVALQCLAGDLAALLRRYRDAETAWAGAEGQTIGPRARYRIALRRAMALLRLDEVDEAGKSAAIASEIAAQHPSETSGDFVGANVMSMLEIMRGADLPAEKPSWGVPVVHSAMRSTVGDGWHRASAITVLWWDLGYARHLWSRQQASLPYAWASATIGDIEAAWVIVQRTREIGAEAADPLLQALVERGDALVAVCRRQPEHALAPLERAFELERALGLPDAKLVDLELTSWRVWTGSATKVAVLDKLEQVRAAGLPSLWVAARQWVPRFVGNVAVLLGVRKLEVSPELAGALAELVGQTRGSDDLSTDRAAARALVGYVRGLGEAMNADSVALLLASARTLAHDDPALLEEIERAF